MIHLEYDEFPKGYETASHPFLSGERMVPHKPNGECIYLNTDGCCIHDPALSLCRTAECRSIAVQSDFETARRLHAVHLIDIRVWDQGRKLLEKKFHKESNK
jgi:hypothetical protein